MPGAETSNDPIPGWQPSDRDIEQAAVAVISNLAKTQGDIDFTPDQITDAIDEYLRLIALNQQYTSNLTPDTARKKAGDKAKAETRKRVLEVLEGWNLTPPGKALLNNSETLDRIRKAINKTDRVQPGGYNVTDPKGLQ